MRYFLELAYKGTHYQGFQVQQNANTIQAEVEKAMGIYFRRPFALTGSSRTDTGVHALQNYFHFDDTTGELEVRGTEKAVYHLNAILPADIVIRAIRRVKDDAHSRFDALSREYRYFLYTNKDPFRRETAYHYPYPLQFAWLQQAAEVVKEYRDFTSFSKRNTQVKTFNCDLLISEWERMENGFCYHVEGNRFLRGMVRALTATMLRVGRGQLSIEQFRTVIESKDCTRARFDVPAQGLFLQTVKYPELIWEFT
jgi:tRNA pseudouridine38-40 synthase